MTVPSSPRLNRLLWLAAGGAGQRPETDAGADYAVHVESNYAVLFERRAFRSFLAQVKRSPQVTHVFLVTDSETAFLQMKAKLPESLKISMLYRDYLANFRINTVEAYR